MISSSIAMPTPPTFVVMPTARPMRSPMMMPRSGTRRGERSRWSPQTSPSPKRQTTHHWLASLLLITADIAGRELRFHIQQVFAVFDAEVARPDAGLSQAQPQVEVIPFHIGVQGWRRRQPMLVVVIVTRIGFGDAALVIIVIGRNGFRFECSVFYNQK